MIYKTLNHLAHMLLSSLISSHYPYCSGSCRHTSLLSIYFVISKLWVFVIFLSWMSYTPTFAGNLLLITSVLSLNAACSKKTPRLPTLNEDPLLYNVFQRTLYFPLVFAKVCIYIIYSNISVSSTRLWLCDTESKSVLLITMLPQIEAQELSVY